MVCHTLPVLRYTDQGHCAAHLSSTDARSTTSAAVLQTTLSPLQGSVPAGDAGASAALSDSALSQLASLQAFSIDTHRAWLDTLTFCPFPAVVTASHCADAGGHPILFATAPCLGMLGQSASRVAGETVEALLGGDAAAAADLSSCLKTGCQFCLPFADAAAGASHIVAFPVTDLAVGGGPLVHLVLFLHGAAASCKDKLTALVSSKELAAAGYEPAALSRRKPVRKGLFAAAGATESNGTEAAQHAALQAAFWAAMGRRGKGRAPLSAVPAAFDAAAWIERFELLLTAAEQA